MILFGFGGYAIQKKFGLDKEDENIENKEAINRNYSTQSD
jgi:hypothetical protein